MHLVASTITPKSVDNIRRTVRRTLTILKRALKRRPLSLSPDLLDPLGRSSETSLQRSIVLVHELTTTLDIGSAHQHIVNVSNVGVQDDGSNGIAPAKHVRRIGTVDDDIGFGADLEDSEVAAAESEGSGAGDEVEGLLDGHGAVGGDLPLLERVKVAAGSEVLQPHAGLVDHGGAVGEVAVDTDGSLVLDLCGVRVVVAEMELRFGCGADVLVGFAQQLGVFVIQEAAVREDHRDGVVEPAVRVQG